MAEEILSGRISPIEAVGGRAGVKPALIKPQQPEAIQFIDNDLKQLGEYHKAQYERARTSEEAAQWQTGWDEIKIVKQRDKNKIAAIQQLIDSGGLDPERGKAMQFAIATGVNLPGTQQPTLAEQRLAELDRIEALGTVPQENIDRARLELTLGAGAAKALYPTPQPERRGRFSPTELDQYQILAEDIQSDVAPLMTSGYNPERMKRAYAEYLERSFYSQANSDQRRELDRAWRGSFASITDRDAWDQQAANDPQIKALRIGAEASPVMRVAAGKVIGRTPVSPMAQHIRESVKTSSAEQDITKLSDEELRRMAGIR